MTEDAIVTAGGWCAPTSLVYDAMSLRSNEFTTASMFPDVRISREWKQPTPEEILARETFARFAVRTAERLARMRHEAIESAARRSTSVGPVSGTCCISGRWASLSPSRSTSASPPFTSTSARTGGMTMTEFNTLPTTGVTLALCLSCGAVVADPEQHAKWHEQMETP
jgi:hypothetical protein